MLSIRALVEELGVFEGNGAPLELKVLGLAFYIQLLSLRRAAGALSEMHRVSKTAVWKCVKKFSGEVDVKHSRMPRRLIAMDETCVKVNGLEYWVYAAIDVDRNEILSMEVSPSRNMIVTGLFISDVLNYCHGKPMFAVDGAPWLTEALKELELKLQCLVLSAIGAL
jgi:putative transposase